VVLYGEGGRMHDAVFSPDGTSIATLTDELRLWSNARGGFESFGAAPYGSALRFSPDGRTLVVAGPGGIAVFAVDSETDPIVLGVHHRVATVLRFTRDGRRVITAANDGAVWSWSLGGSGDGTAPPRRLVARDDVCWDMVLSPDDTHAAVSYQDRTVEIVRTDGEGAPLVLSGHTGGVPAIAFEPGGRTLITAADDGTARRWNIDGTGGDVIIDDRRDHAVVAEISPDASRYLAGTPDGTVRVWSTRAPTAPPAVLRGLGEATVAKFSNDGARLAIGTAHGTVWIWDMHGAPIVLRGHTAAVTHLGFDPRGERLASASDDGTARVWRVDGRGDPVVLRANAKVGVVAFSPDGRWIVTALSDETAAVWRADGSGEPVVLRGHVGGVWIVAFTPDGRRVVTTSDDRTVRLWRYRLDDLVDLLRERTRACPTDEERRALPRVEWREADARCR